MPILTPIGRLLAALGLALASLSLASVADAKTTPVELRVVDAAGRTLADQTQYTGSTKIKTDPKAKCFVGGTGGSGDKVRLPGATALGILEDGGAVQRRLDPLSVTDEFDFGLGLCGVGETIAPETGGWLFKLNHEAPSAGADATKVGRGDEVLWYLVDDFSEMPDELVLKAPARVDAGAEVPVRVFSYDDAGKREPAAGVKVDLPIGSETTDAQGRATLDLGEADYAEITATRKGSIRSNAAVCLDELSDCPPGYAKIVGGSAKPDRIVGGAAAETILGGGGNDVIDATEGKAPDSITCGAGKDEVSLGKNAKTSVLKGCEKVRAPGKGK